MMTIHKKKKKKGYEAFSPLVAPVISGRFVVLIEHFGKIIKWEFHGVFLSIGFDTYIFISSRSLLTL